MDNETQGGNYYDNYVGKFIEPENLENNVYSNMPIYQIIDSSQSQDGETLFTCETTDKGLPDKSEVEPGVINYISLNEVHSHFHMLSADEVKKANLVDSENLRSPSQTDNNFTPPSLSSFREANAPEQVSQQNVEKANDTSRDFGM